jgi:hypothetical protein
MHEISISEQRKGKRYPALHLLVEVSYICTPSLSRVGKMASRMPHLLEMKFAMHSALCVSFMLLHIAIRVSLKRRYPAAN